jgi:hypothetical protein
MNDLKILSNNPSMDLFLSDSFEDLQGGLASLTDMGREANSLPLPIPSGTRVAFRYNTGSVLGYDNIPDRGVHGTVVLVKMSSGSDTSHDGMVFVKWDDGVFRPIHAQHLKRAKTKSKKAFNIRFETSDLMKVALHFEASTPEELIHRSSKDLWRLKNSKGKFVIERLFDEKGEPLKV